MQFRTTRSFCKLSYASILFLATNSRPLYPSIISSSSHRIFFLLNPCHEMVFHDCKRNLGMASKSHRQEVDEPETAARCEYSSRPSKPRDLPLSMSNTRQPGKTRIHLFLPKSKVDCLHTIHQQNSRKMKRRKRHAN